MKAQINHLISQLRIFESNDAKYGEPYAISAIIKWIDSESIEISGLDRAITIPAWKAVLKLCQEMKIKRVLAVRYRNGVPVDRWIDVPKEKKNESKGSD
jgi:hypothetical protein